MGRRRRTIAGAVMDVSAIAEYLGCSEHQVRARIARGQLPYRRWGGRIVGIRSELDEYLRSLPGVSAAEAREIGS